MSASPAAAREVAPLIAADRDALAAEGDRLIRFIADDDATDIRFADPSVPRP